MLKQSELEMKNIIHLTSVHNRDDNRIFYKQCIDLASDGYNVTLAVADGRGHALSEHVSIVDFRCLPWNNRIVRLLFSSPILVLRALRLRGDLYHIHDPEVAFYFILFSPFFSSKKFLFDMHENLSEQVKAKAWVPWILQPVLSACIKYYERIVYRSVPIVFAEHSYLKSFPKVKTHETVLNFPKSVWGRELDDHAKGENTPTIGYVGRIGQDRGICELLSAVRAINDTGRRLRLCLLGHIPKEIEANPDFQHLQHNAFLDAPGFVNNLEAANIVRTWDIGFCVLKELPNFIESYPTKMFEYFAAGVPVISSDFPLYADLMEEMEGGICIRPDSSDLLIEAITKILNNPILYRPNFDEEKYGWAGQLSKLKTFYEKLL